MVCNASMMGLNNTLFTNNYAGEYGAALCREANATGGFGGNNTFIKNDAGIAGAALAWLGVDGININNYTFINNTAFKSGGAIYVRGDSPNCKVRNSYFDTNYITDVKNGQGGAIDWVGSNGLIANTTFVDSIAVNGGTIFAGVNSTNLTVFNSSFVSSRALGDGGAIALYSDNAKITYSNFTFSLALISGGAISGHNADNTTIDYCIFDYGMGAGYIDSSLKAFGEGGAIHWENSTDLSISNSNFLNLRSNANGGSISAVNCNDSTLYNLTFNNEVSSLNGGSISWINSTNLTFDSLKVNKSKAFENGGAFYLIGVNDTTIKNSIFNDVKTPDGNGGGIYVDGNVTVQNSTFANYDASIDYGGALYFNGGISTVIDSNFTGRDAIWVYRPATVHLTNNNITGPNPNKNMTYLENDYDSKYNPVDYSVWNDGILYLDKNSFDYVIFNNGTIMTQTYLDLLNNSTYEVEWNTTFTFFANITDDNDNTIISVHSLGTYNNHPEYDSGIKYNLTYNRLPLPAYIQDVFLLSGNDTGLAKCSYRNGTLKVKMQPIMKITRSEEVDENITFTAEIIIPYDGVNSNYTINKNEQVHFVIGGKDYYGNISCVSTDNKHWIIAYANVTLNHMHTGTYMVTATYDGDDHHFGVTNYTTVVLKARPIWIIIEVADIYYGQTLICNVSSNATNTENGFIWIRINGKELAIGDNKLEDNGTKIIYIDESVYKDLINVTGEYTASVMFNNGTYYDYQINFTTFHVKKFDTNITANVTTPIVHDQNEIINVTVNETATGFVKITIPGYGYIIEEIDHGKAQFNISGLAVGEYINCTIEYYGDVFFNGNSTNVTFTVIPASDYILDVKVDDIIYGNNATVRVLVPTHATGNVTIYVDGKKVGTVNITNGTASLSNITGLAGGVHIVNVTYNGDAEHYPKDKNGTEFTVHPTKDWSMSINGDYKPYGENTTITITVPSDVRAKNVTIMIDGVSYVRDVIGNVATLTLNNLSAGRHEANVSYAGNANYTYKLQKFFPDIPKATPVITLIQNGTDLIAIVTNSTGGNISGNVTFRLNKGVHTVNITGNNATLKDILLIGDNYVLAIYNGNENYTSVEVSDVFNVGNFNTTITVNATNVTYGQTVNITVTVNRTAEGFIAVRIGSQIYSAYVVNGTAKFNISGLATGIYTANVTFFATGDFNNNVTNVTFRVDPTTDYVLDVKVDNITYGQNATIRVKVPTDATGNVTIYVDGIPKGTVNITEGSAELIVDKLSGGEHVVNVTYNGDSSYSTKDKNGTKLKVSPTNDWDMSITAEYKPYSEYSVITVKTAPYNLTHRYLTITIDGIKHNVTIGDDGIATLRLNNLSAGRHVANVSYVGDANYSAKQKNFFPDIPQADPTLIITRVNGDVIVTIPENATGNISVFINGKTYENKTVNGVATFKDVLHIGFNYVTASYPGDKNYTKEFNMTTFEIVKTGTDLTVVATPTSIILGNNVLITVTMDNVTAGKVLIEVNNYNYTVDINSNGIATLELALPVGTYTPKAYYLGDVEHAASNKTGNAFEVIDKITPEITITVPSDLKVGDVVNITVTSNGYNLTVWIDGVKQTIVNGNITYTVPSDGIHTIFANTTENATHYSANKTVVFEAVKNNATLIISDINIVYVGDQVIITVTPTTDGAITIKVDDVVINNGDAFTPNLEGKYTITVESAETVKYNAGFNSTVFTAYKRISQINVTATGNSVGGNATITVQVQTNATGYVTVNVNGTNYTIALNSTGAGSVNITGLGNGTYYVHATYLGDDQYLTSTNDTVTFEMTKVDTTMVINNTKSITLPIDNGKVNWIVSGLAADNYTVYANYSGDGKYNLNNTDKVKESFEVKQISPVVDIVKVISEAGKNASVIVRIDPRTTENITVTVNNKAYSIKPNVDGFAVVVTDVLENGTYTAVARYVGDKNFTAGTDQFEFTTNKTSDYVMNVTANDVKVDELTDIVVNVPVDAKGIVKVEIDGVNYTAVIKDGKAVFANETNLPVGKYNVTAYFGNDKYANKTATGVFYISPLDTPISIGVDDIKVGDKAIITVTVPVGVTDNVTIEIDGVKYNKSVDATGKAVFEVQMLSNGTRTVVAVYAGDAKYVANSTTANFTVSKRVSQVNVTAAGNSVGGNATITVQVQTNATGYVTINVNGTNYTVKLDNVGYGSVQIAGLGNGTYYVHATYLGDDQYLTSTNDTVTFEMTKVDTTMVLLVLLDTLQ